MFPGRWNESITAMELYASYKNGSTEARQVFERAGVYIGRGLAILLDVLNPERIILGGIGMRIGDAFLSAVKEVVRQEAIPQAVDACQIVPAQLGESIGDVASLCAALDQGGLRRVS
jgi:glucokinase